MNHLRLIRAPDYVYAHSNKGTALTCLGDLQAMLSRRYEASGRYAQAIAAFDEALSRVPSDVYAHNPFSACVFSRSLTVAVLRG